MRTAIAPTVPSSRLVLTAMTLALALACDSPSGSRPPQLTTVVVTPGTATLFAIGDSVQLSATGLDEGNNPIPGLATTWTSADSTVARVTATGRVTALQNGVSVISATMDTVTGTATITVAQAVTQVTVNPVADSATAIGDSTLFSAVGRDAGGTPVAGVTFLWSTSDANVATVTPGGMAVAVASGSVWIVASAGPARDSGRLTVSQTPAALRFSVEPTSPSGAGAVLAPAPQVSVVDARGNLVATATTTITVALAPHASGATLGGTPAVAAAGGVATFSDLTVSLGGTGFRLVATAPGLASDTSAAFDVP
jgi:hypothetical protein